MKKHSVKKLFLFHLAFVSLVLAGQNCSNVNYTSDGLTGNKAVGGGGPGVDPVTGQPTNNDGQQSPPDNDSGGTVVACDQEIKELQVAVKAIVARDHQGQEIEVAPVAPILTLSHFKTGIPVSFPEAVEISDLRLILEEEGNKVVDKSGASHPLKTPSQQQSGLKVHLASGEVQLEKAKIYKITGFDFDSQLKSNPHGCMLHPVWQNAALQ